MRETVSERTGEQGIKGSWGVRRESQKTLELADVKVRIAAQRPSLDSCGVAVGTW